MFSTNNRLKILEERVVTLSEIVNVLVEKVARLEKNRAPDIYYERQGNPEIHNHPPQIGDLKVGEMYQYWTPGEFGLSGINSFGPPVIPIATVVPFNEILPTDINTEVSEWGGYRFKNPKPIPLPFNNKNIDKNEKQTP